MKTSKLLIAGFLLAATIVSCNKDTGNSNQFVVVNGVPTSIPIANNGGNVTCDEVALATGGTFSNTSGRIDYYGGTGSWTVGPITWYTDGTYVGWESTVFVNVAIIIKGGPNAQVYYSGLGNCETGTGYTTEGKVKLSLSAPINPKTGNPYGLSNITFCYNVCENQKVVSLKGWLKNGKHFVSSGNILLFMGVGGWCEPLGYNLPSTTFDVVYTESPYDKIGKASVSPSGEVTFDLTQEVDFIRLFIGTLDELQEVDFPNSWGCPDYSSWTLVDFK